MATAYTPILKLALPVTGELNGTWGDVVNQNITEMVEQAVAGLATINTWTTNSHTLTTANGTTSESRCAMLVIDDDGAGNPSAAATVICPTATKSYIVRNLCGQTVTVKTAAGTGVAVPNNQAALVFCDGTNVVTGAFNGDVVGPATATNNAIVTFDGTTGKLIKDNSGATISAGVITATGFSGPLNGSVGASTPSTVVATQVDITAQGDLRLQDTTGGEFVALQAPGTLATSYTLTLPVDDGTSGQALITDGSGVLSWSTAASGDVYGPASATDNAVARYDGTTGKIIQNSSVIIDDSNNVSGVAQLTTSSDATINGVKVGRGGGNVSTNTAVGANAINATATGTSNTAVGTTALRDVTSGVSNTALGASALIQSTTGDYNIAIGSQAMFSNTSGGSSVAIGFQSLYFNTTGTFNNAFGRAALNANTTGANNIGIGSSALLAITTTSNNTAVGHSAGSLITTGAKNTLLGCYTGNQGGLDIRTASNNIVLSDGDGNPRQYYEGANNAWIWQTAGSEQMRLTATGLGIGTTTPSYKFVVAPSGASSDQLVVFRDASSWTGNGGVVLSNYFANTTNIGGIKISAENVSQGYLTFHTGGIIERMRIAVNGNVGIGTASPDANLTVNGAASFAAGTALLPSIARASDLNTGFWFPAADTIAASTAGSEHMRINSSGNVGIGTTTPQAKLDVNGNARMGSFDINSSGAKTVWIAGSDFSFGTFYGNALLFLTSDTERMRITSAGNVGIGTSSPAQKLDVNGDALINGVNVGRGGGSVATNTAVGASALSANTTGTNNVAVGTQALLVNTIGTHNVAIGLQAGFSNTAGYGLIAIGQAAAYSTTKATAGYTGIVAIGGQALYSNTSGGANIGIGGYDIGNNAPALYANTTGSYNIAVGTSALALNTTASNNTALGYKALAANTTTSNNTAVGYQAGLSNTTGEVTAFGTSAGRNNTTGSNLTAIGYLAASSNTTGSANTAVGMQSLSTNTTGIQNTMLGYLAGNVMNANNSTFIGQAAGSLITSGTNNTLLGRYTGNQGGLDIRTASNNIVLSDGDGNPRQYYEGANNAWIWQTAGSERMRLTSIGDLGLGTTSPEVPFHIRSAYPVIALEESDVAANNKKWWFEVNGGIYQARILNDAVNAASTWLKVTRSGTTVSSVEFPSGNVGIGTVAPNASALLDVQSTTKGVRMPNMTTGEKNAIASPAAGLMVYDTTLSKLCVYTTAWETITSI